MNGLTSPVVDLFQVGVCQGNRSLDCIDLIDPTGRRQDKPLSVKKGNHVLPTGPFFGLPADVESTAKLYMTKRAHSAPRCRIKLLLLCQRGLGRLNTKANSYLVWEHKTVLENPRLLQDRSYPRIVRCSVDLSSDLSEPDQSILNLHVRTWAIDHRGVLQQLREEQWIFAHSLDWLSRVGQLWLSTFAKGHFTFIRRSLIVRLFLDWPV